MHERKRENIKNFIMPLYARSKLADKMKQSVALRTLRQDDVMGFARSGTRWKTNKR